MKIEPNENCIPLVISSETNFFNGEQILYKHSLNLTSHLSLLLLHVP